MNVYTQHIGNVKLKVDRMIVKGPMVLNSQPFTTPPPPLQKHGPGFRRRPAEPEDVSYKFTEERKWCLGLGGEGGVLIALV